MRPKYRSFSLVEWALFDVWRPVLPVFLPYCSPLPIWPRAEKYCRNSIAIPNYHPPNFAPKLSHTNNKLRNYHILVFEFSSSCPLYAGRSSPPCGHEIHWYSSGGPGCSSDPECWWLQFVPMTFFLSWVRTPFDLQWARTPSSQPVINLLLLRSLSFCHCHTIIRWSSVCWFPPMTYCCGGRSSAGFPWSLAFPGDLL